MFERRFSSCPNFVGLPAYLQNRLKFIDLQVVTLDSGNEKRPSTRLQEKIKNCVSMFRSLNETVNEVIELGRNEGFASKEIGHFIREEMTKAGLSRSTVTRYLPAELKLKPRGKTASLAQTEPKMAKSREPKQPKSTKEFVFTGRLSKASGNRYAFVWPSKENKNLQHYLGREVTVAIS